MTSSDWLPQICETGLIMLLEETLEQRADLFWQLEKSREEVLHFPNLLALFFSLCCTWEADGASSRANMSSYSNGICRAQKLTFL